LAATDGEAEGFSCGLDVEEAGKPGLGEAEVRRVGEFGWVESVVKVALGGVTAVGGGQSKSAGAAGVAFLVCVDMVSDTNAAPEYNTYLYSRPLLACASE